VFERARCVHGVASSRVDLPRPRPDRPPTATLSAPTARRRTRQAPQRRAARTGAAPGCRHRYTAARTHSPSRARRAWTIGRPAPAVRGRVPIPEEDRRIVKSLLEEMIIKFQTKQMVGNLSS